MNREEAEKYAKIMTYRDAVYNALQGKCIPYRKATLTKLYKLLDMIETQKIDDAHRWVPVSERLPEEEGDYLTTVNGLFSTHNEIISFTNNLHKLDKYGFPDKKRHGWYFFDREYGYIEETDVIAWMPLPEIYNAES